MRRFITAIPFLVFLFNLNCSNTKPIVNDISCFREINTEIASHIENEKGIEYDSIKSQLKLVLKFYINESGTADSILFVKSNLGEFDIKESLLLRSLEDNKYKCFRDVFYSDSLKPESIVVTFNPELVYTNR